MILMMMRIMKNTNSANLSTIKYNSSKSKKILPPNQLLQRYSILLAQVQVGNTSENLFSEITQVAYSLYQQNKF